MYIVQDQTNNKLALIQRNIIMSLSGNKVLGIAVGDCLFNGDSKVFGKIIQSKAYDLKGAIIGNIVFSNPISNLSLSHDQINHSWNILSNIKEHICPWIEITDEWSLLSFSDYLI